MFRKGNCKETVLELGLPAGRERKLEVVTGRGWFIVIALGSPISNYLNEFAMRRGWERTASEELSFL